MPAWVLRVDEAAVRNIRDVDIGLIDAGWTERFPAELAARLQELVDNPEG